MADTSLPVSGTQGTAPTSPLADALRAILAEVTPGTRPYNSDSWLPDHLVDAAEKAIAQHESESAQHAYNALSTAAWHIARGEPAKALARMRRAKSHITAMMEASAATTTAARA